MANFFGGILVLCFGLLIFFGISLRKNITDETFLIIIGIIIFVGIVSYFLMMHFSYKVPEIKKFLEEESIKTKYPDGEFVINEDRLETLKAAGVADDVINCLKKFITELQSEKKQTEVGKNNLAKKKKELTMTLVPKSEESWLDNLIDNLGVTRVNEFEESLLKYTYRKIKNQNS